MCFYFFSRIILSVCRRCLAEVGVEESAVGRQIITVCSFTLHAGSCWGRGVTDAWFISNGRLWFSGLSDAGQGAVTLGRAGVLEDTALTPRFLRALLICWRMNDRQPNTSRCRVPALWLTFSCILLVRHSPIAIFVASIAFLTIAYL